MPEPELTTAILREIRDEIRSTRTDLGERLDAVRIELKAEIGETNARLSVVEETLKDLAAQMLMLTRYVKNVVDRHEQSIDDLRERLVRLESRFDKP